MTRGKGCGVCVMFTLLTLCIGFSFGICITNAMLTMPNTNSTITGNPI